MSSSTLTLDEALAPYSAAARQAGVALPALLTALMEDVSAVQRALGRLVKGGGAETTTQQEADAAKAEIYALAEELRAYGQALANGEEIPEEVKRRMQPQPGARERAAQVMRAIDEEVARSGLPGMTMDEISAEIAAARRERRERERAAA